ncbi:hypothetical protein HW49_06170, partial [Porphyromonadaceae bacterium COT-184 OH4590]
MRGALMIILGTLFCSCGEPQYTIPTDKDMVVHFLQNRKDFELLKQWIEEDGLEQAYPPYLSSRDSDTLYMQKLSVERRKEYDSLLLRINCKRISVASDIITFEYLVLLIKYIYVSLCKKNMNCPKCLCEESVRSGI